MQYWFYWMGLPFWPAAPVTRCDGSKGEIETGDRYRDVCCPSAVLPGNLLFAARAARGSGQYPFMSWSGSRQMFGRMFATDDQDKLGLAEFAALEPIDSHTHIARRLRNS